jgi:hypothetical protein
MQLNEPIAINLVLVLLLVAIGIFACILNVEGDGGPDGVTNQSARTR